MNDLTDRMTNKRLDQYMYVIWHDNPRKQPISLTVKAQERVFHEARNVRVA